MLSKKRYLHILKETLNPSKIRTWDFCFLADFLMYGKNDRIYFTNCFYMEVRITVISSSQLNVSVNGILRVIWGSTWSAWFLGLRKAKDCPFPLIDIINTGGKGTCIRRSEDFLDVSRMSFMYVQFTSRVLGVVLSNEGYCQSVNFVLNLYRSSHPGMRCKKFHCKNFVKFTKETIKCLYYAIDFCYLYQVLLKWCHNR